MATSASLIAGTIGGSSKRMISATETAKRRRTGGGKNISPR